MKRATRTNLYREHSRMNVPEIFVSPSDILPKPPTMNYVRIENDEYLMTVCCERSLEESFYGAAREMLYWMMDYFGFSREKAYLLMGQVLEARGTQFVNPTRSYICKIPKRRFLANGSLAVGSDQPENMVHMIQSNGCEK